VISLRELLSKSQVLLLGWTLVHFLWEGALIAMILSVVLKGMKRQSADARYAVACAAMLGLLLCPIATLLTFAPEFVRRVTASGGDAVPATTFGLLLSAVGRLLDSPSANELLRATVGAWGVGVLFLLARLTLGWLRVQQVRRAAVPVTCMPIRGRMSVMALRIGIDKPIRLMESALAEGPAVVGFLRPMILLPTAAITGLWPVQIEAILAHELAHIRRHDYLANLLQSFVETLLFYHPAVWWVSARIREERENCCDDLAVKACGDRAFYAGCLADLDDLRPSPMELAMGAAGGSLLSRIRRILLVPDRETRTAAPAAAALAMIMSFGLVLAGFAQARGGESCKPARAVTTGAQAQDSPLRSAPIEVPHYETVANDDEPRPPLLAAPVVSAPRIPFPDVNLSTVWAAGQWLEKLWPELPAPQIHPEALHQAAHQLQVPQQGDFEQPTDFPDVLPMSEVVHVHGIILPGAQEAIGQEAFGGSSWLGVDFSGETSLMPPSVTGVPLTAVSPLNTTVGAPLNTVTGGPLNTVTGGPLMTAQMPLTTVVGGPLMTAHGPIMVTTNNPMVTRGPNYPQLVPNRGPATATTVQVRRSR
jgi:beta-lactamase regulating signal transducer with metallopeptidase domain